VSAEVHYSAKAEADLEQIVDYTLQRWGANQANEYINGLEALAKQLAQRPAMGLPNILDITTLFAFPYKSHTLYYLKKESGISVVRVLHQSMLPEKHLKDG